MSCETSTYISAEVGWVAAETHESTLILPPASGSNHYSKKCTHRVWKPDTAPFRCPGIDEHGFDAGSRGAQLQRHDKRMGYPESTGSQGREGGLPRRKKRMQKKSMATLGASRQVLHLVW